jgi:UDP-N-acetylmuramate dehydrogenase
MTRPLPDDLLTVPHRRDVSFARLTTLGVGGLCRWLFEPTTELEAQTFVRACAREGLPWRVLGGGSNLVVLGDLSFPILRLAFPKAVTRQADHLTAPASHGHIALAEAAAAAGLSGLEFASGIPGSLGGAIRMNAGAYGREWVDVLARYRFLTPEGDLVEKAPDPGEFRYRWSFLTGGRVVLSATAALAPGDPQAIRARVAEYRAKRGTSQPLSKRNAGCVFKNPPGLSAGRLIDEAGLKGLRIGDAEVSPEHANFLINHGHATAAEFAELMAQVQAKVQAIHGVALESEVEIWDGATEAPAPEDRSLASGGPDATRPFNHPLGS